MTAIKVMIFTKNEEVAISQLINETRACLASWDYQIILVDDSSDRTPFIAKEMGCAVINNNGLGLGRAYMRALRKAGESPFQFLVTMDGDGQVDPVEIPRFIQVAQSTGADLVLGSRFIQEGLIDYSYPRLNRFGVYLLSWFLSFECRMKITDSHGGLRVHSPQCANQIDVRGSHTYVQESILDAYKKNFRIVETYSRWRVRAQGQSRVVRSILYYIKKVLPVLMLKAERSRWWGLSLIISGLIWVLSEG